MECCLSNYYLSWRSIEPMTHSDGVSGDPHSIPGSSTMTPEMIDYQPVVCRVVMCSGSSGLVLAPLAVETTIQHAVHITAWQQTIMQNPGTIFRTIRPELHGTSGSRRKEELAWRTTFKSRSNNKDTTKGFTIRVVSEVQHGSAEITSLSAMTKQAKVTNCTKPPLEVSRSHVGWLPEAWEVGKPSDLWKLKPGSQSRQLSRMVN